MKTRKYLMTITMAATFAAEVSAIQYAYIDVDAVVTNSPSPQVTFTWDSQADWATIEIARREMGTRGTASPWDVRATISHPNITFTDTVEPGVVHEYRLRRPYNEAYSPYREVSSFVAVALDAPLVDDRGGVLLVVDNTLAEKLATELAQLEMDLAGDGWTVERLDFSRHGSAQPSDLRAAVSNAWAASNGNLKSLYLFGHLPVVKSGFINPDGHGSRPHAADGYYADADGEWTDVGTYTGTSENLPGDGIYDPSLFPGALELMPGRVDFANMPSYRKHETEYLRDYIHKSHAFRHGQRTEVSRRGLWRSDYLWPERNWIKPLFGTENITNVAFQPELSTNAYLFAIDSGVPGGANPNYTAMPNKLVFGINFASYKQEWDRADNEMRGLLAQPDWGLTCAWGARPSWFFHHMGAGLTAGYSAMRSMDNTSSDYMPCGDYSGLLRYVHSAMMGDPTLRLHPVAPPEAVAVSKDGDAAVLTWSASPDAALLGYHVYASTNRLGPYERLTAEPIESLCYTNASPPAAEHWYQVRTVKREATPAAVYTNASQGVFARLGADGTSNQIPTAQPVSVAASRDQMTDVALTGSDPDGDTLVPFVLTNPRHGHLRWTESQLLYLPDAGFAGEDSLRFAMSDGTTVGEPVDVVIDVASAGNLLEWEFASPPSNNIPQNLTCTGHATGILPATVTAGPKASFRTDLAVFQRDAFCLYGGALGGLDPELYVEWQVSPEPLHRFDLSGVSFGLWNMDSAKPLRAALRWSDDGFATWQAVPVAGRESVSYAGFGYDVTAGMPFAASLADVQALRHCTNAVAFRLYFWYDTVSSYPGIGKIGEARIDLAVSGAVLSIAPPVITGATQAEGRLGESFEYRITAENTPTGFAASGLPDWASIDPDTGVISGTPDATGVSQVLLSATNAWGEGTGPLEIVVGYVVEATAGEGGTIEPSGRIGLAEGATQAFAIAAGRYATIADVLVDGVSIGAVTQHAFTGVQTNHTIHATFTPRRTPNGTPISWLADLGYTDNFEEADLADPDGDATPNWIEYRDETDPLDPLSRPAFNTVPYAESFENLSGWGGAPANVAGKMGWFAAVEAGDDSRIAPMPYAYTAGNPPLAHTTHTNVLALETGAGVLSSSFGEGFSMTGGLAYVDLLVRAVPAEGRPPDYKSADMGLKAGVYVGAEGRLAVYHGVAAMSGAWISNTVTQTGTPIDIHDWFRLTYAFDATLGSVGPPMFQVWVDGSVVTNAMAYPDDWKTQYVATGTLPSSPPGGSWFRFATADADAGILHAIEFTGDGHIDDLVADVRNPLIDAFSLILSRRGGGTSSLGDSEFVVASVPSGVSTQIVYHAADWHRIASLALDGEAVPEAIGQPVYTQNFFNVSANVSNDVAFALATPEQTGFAGVPTPWLANWSEAAVAAAPDDGFDVPMKYRLGLDPTASNTYALAVASFAVEGANAVAVAHREVTGPLSPDGMHGWLILQWAADLGSGFTNLTATAVTGADVFDGTGRRAFTNAVPEGSGTGFYRVVVEPAEE